MYVELTCELACNDCADCPSGPGSEFHSGNFPIESIRAALLAGEPREQRYCSDCQPHFRRGEKLNFEDIFELVMMNDDEDDWCCCTLADQFIEDCWLCIPCFIKQEAQAYSRRLKKQSFKLEANADGSTRKPVRTVVRFLMRLLGHC